MEVLRAGNQRGDTSDHGVGACCPEVAADVGSGADTGVLDATSSETAGLPGVSREELRREKRLAYFREYGARHRQRRLAFSARHYASLHGRASTLVHTARRRAAAKGIVFELSADCIEAMLALGVCQATGIPFCFERTSATRMNPFSPSLDRIDPTKGYTVNNVRLVCSAYNVARGQWGDEVLLTIAKALMEKTEEICEAWELPWHAH